MWNVDDDIEHRISGNSERVVGANIRTRLLGNHVEIAVVQSCNLYVYLLGTRVLTFLPARH